MRPYFYVFAVAAILVASPVVQASRRRSMTFSQLVSLSRQASQQSAPSQKSTPSQQSAPSQQNVQSFSIETFAVNVAYIVTRYPLDQINKKIIYLKKETTRRMESRTVPVNILLQKIDQKKLTDDRIFADRFLCALEAIKNKSGKRLSLQFDVRNYFFLKKLYWNDLWRFGMVIGDVVPPAIEKTLADSGLGIDSSWDLDLVRWVLEHYPFGQSWAIRFSRGDLAAAWCAVIDAEKARADPNSSSPLNPTIIHAVIARMKNVWQQMKNDSYMFELKPSIQRTLRQTTLESQPLPYSFTNMRDCIRDRPASGAILAAFRQVLDSARFYEIPQGTRSQLKELSFDLLTGQTRLFGIGAVELWWLTASGIDYFDQYPVRDVYSRIHGQSSDSSDSKPKKSELGIPKADYGFFGWQMQRHIVRALVLEEKYSQAFDVIKFLGDHRFLPAKVAGQIGEIEENLMTPGWLLSKEKKLDRLERMLKKKGTVTVESFDS